MILKNDTIHVKLTQFVIRLKLFLILCDFTATMEAAQRSLSKHF